MPGLLSPKTGTPSSARLDDPKTLQNTEEQVKNFLTALSSPNRTAPQAISKGMARPIPSFSSANSPMMPAPTSRPSSNIVLEYQYGKDPSM